MDRISPRQLYVPLGGQRPDEGTESCCSTHDKSKCISAYGGGTAWENRYIGTSDCRNWSRGFHSIHVSAAGTRTGKFTTLVYVCVCAVGSWSKTVNRDRRHQSPRRPHMICRKPAPMSLPAISKHVVVPGFFRPMCIWADGAEALRLFVRRPLRGETWCRGE